DHGPARRLLLGHLHVHREAGVDEPDADLRDGLEARVVDHVDRLDAGSALADLLRVDDERPDLVTGRIDLDRAFELHASSIASVPGAASYTAGSRLNRVRQPIEQNA